VPPGLEDQGPLAAARSRAERLWRVTERVEPEAKGPGTALRRVLRRWARSAVDPLAARQQEFNAAALALVDTVSERVDAATASSASAAARVRELEERVLRLERRPPQAPAAATAAAQPAAAALPDYFAFESRMRGSTEEIARRLRPYVDDLREAAPVLDLGCGRGELLRLLRDAGVEARGVDANADMVAYARGEGLDVGHADALEYLAGLPDASLGAVVSVQVVEHLPPPALLRLLELAATRLRPGGLLLLETLNPASPLALRNYFADLTHAQPLVPETLVMLVQSVGLRETEVRFLNAPPEEERLQPVQLSEDPAFDEARRALAANVGRLNEQLFGPLDYAVIARRGS
jgi:SAM-dependent methyltransferase